MGRVKVIGDIHLFEADVVADIAIPRQCCHCKILIDESRCHALGQKILIGMHGSSLEFEPASFSTADERNELLRREWAVNAIYFSATAKNAQ